MVRGSSAEEFSDRRQRGAQFRTKALANLIRHIYEVDPLLCPRCGGAMKIISFITEQRAIRAILDSVRRSGTPASGAHVKFRSLVSAFRSPAAIKLRH